MPLQPKALHDEMNSTNFDEYGRMQATLGVEAQPADADEPERDPVPVRPTRRPSSSNGTNLPKQDVTRTTPTATP